jgi:hypothetical protein
MADRAYYIKTMQVGSRQGIERQDKRDKSRTQEIKTAKVGWQAMEKR